MRTRADVAGQAGALCPGALGSRAKRARRTVIAPFAATPAQLFYALRTAKKGAAPGPDCAPFTGNTSSSATSIRSCRQPGLTCGGVGRLGGVKLT